MEKKKSNSGPLGYGGPVGRAGPGHSRELYCQYCKGRCTDLCFYSNGVDIRELVPLSEFILEADEEAAEEAVEEAVDETAEEMRQLFHAEPSQSKRKIAEEIEKKLSSLSVETLRIILAFINSVNGQV